MKRLRSGMRMTESELAEVLRKMREHGSLNPMTILFGIIFSSEIRDLGPGAASRIADEYNRRGYTGTANHAPIRDGLRLAPYVNPRPDMLRRWRRGG